MSRLLVGGLAAVALAAGAAVPGTAAADSIAYVKDGNAWLTTPDGARHLQVTRTGDVAYVSQADDGTMVALVGGERLRRIGRDGRTLAEFPTYVSDGAPVPGPTNRFHGPFAPQISPDGSLVAFEWFNDTYSPGAGCDAVNGCYLHKGSQGVGITRSDRFTGHEEFGVLTGWQGPRWMDGDTLLRSYSGANFTDDAVFTEVGAGIGGSRNDPWFTDVSGRGAVRDVVLSRDRGAVVGVGGSGEGQLRIYRTLVEPFGAPDFDHRPFAHNEPVVEQCYERDAGKVEEPTVAPDGRAVAYGTPEGIRAADLPDLRGGCPPPPPGDRLIVPGGHHPDWGPADVPASIPAPGADAPGPASPTPPPTRGPDRIADGRRTLIVSAPRTAKRARVRRDGLTLRVSARAAGTVGVTAKVGGRTVGTATRRLRSKGSVRLRVPVARRALLGRRPVTVLLAASFTPAAGDGSGTQRATARVRVGTR